jgi:hypothetical protein
MIHTLAFGLFLATADIDCEKYLSKLSEFSKNQISISSVEPIRSLPFYLDVSPSRMNKGSIYMIGQEAAATTNETREVGEKVLVIYRLKGSTLLELPTITQQESINRMKKCKSMLFEEAPKPKEIVISHQ